MHHHKWQRWNVVLNGWVFRRYYSQIHLQTYFILVGYLEGREVINRCFYLGVCGVDHLESKKCPCILKWRGSSGKDDHGAKIAIMKLDQIKKQVYGWKGVQRLRAKSKFVTVILSLKCEGYFL